MEVVLVGYLTLFACVVAVPQVPHNIQSYHLEAAGGPTYRVSSSNSGFNIENAGGDRSFSSLAGSHSSPSSIDSPSAPGLAQKSASPFGQQSSAVFGSQRGSNLGAQSIQDSSYYSGVGFGSQAAYTSGNTAPIFGDQPVAFNPHSPAGQFSAQNVDKQKSFTSFTSSTGSIQNAGASSQAQVGSRYNGDDTSISGVAQIVAQPIVTHSDIGYVNPGVSKFNSDAQSSHTAFSAQNTAEVQGSSELPNQAAVKFDGHSSGFGSQTVAYGATAGYNSGIQSAVNRIGSEKSTYGYGSNGEVNREASTFGAHNFGSQSINAGQFGFDGSSSNRFGDKTAVSQSDYGASVASQSSGTYSSQPGSKNIASNTGSQTVYNSAFDGQSAVQKSPISSFGRKSSQTGSYIGSQSVPLHALNSGSSFGTQSSGTFGSQNSAVKKSEKLESGAQSAYSAQSGLGFSSHSSSGGRSNPFQNSASNIGSEAYQSHPVSAFGEKLALQNPAFAGSGSQSYSNIGAHTTDLHDSQLGSAFGAQSSSTYSTGSQNSAAIKSGHSGFSVQPTYTTQSGSQLNSYSSASEQSVSSHNAASGFGSQSGFSSKSGYETQSGSVLGGHVTGTNIGQSAASSSSFGANSAFVGQSAGVVGSPSLSSHKSLSGFGAQSGITYGAHSATATRSQSATKSAAPTLGDQSGLTFGARSQAVKKSTLGIGAESSYDVQSYGRAQSGVALASQSATAQNSASSFGSQSTSAFGSHSNAAEFGGQSTNDAHYGSAYDSGTANAHVIRSTGAQRSYSKGSSRGKATFRNKDGSALKNSLILSQVHDQATDGSKFNYAYEADNGISAQGIGIIKNFGTENEIQEVKGSYSYPGDDGIIYTVNYVADETGFHPEGQHLPKMSEEIARSIEYNLAHPEEEVEEYVYEKKTTNN